MEAVTSVVQKFNFADNYPKVFVAILVVALLAGTATGYILANTSSNKVSQLPISQGAPKFAQQDTKTFRDFAQGKIAKKPHAQGGDYSEGTHLLIRDGAVPVALTSSVIDLSQYEGKDVKVYGETQKALKEGWLMDVGRAEVKSQ